MLIKFLLLALISSCSSVTSNVKISSFPEGASVGIKENDGKIRSLGQTPLTAPMSSSMGMLVLSKDGYVDQSIFLAVDSSSPNTNISAKLQPKHETREAESSSKMERLARDLISAHNHIGKKRYIEAQSILQTLTRDYPQVSVSYDLLGNIAYLQRDSRKALQFYERSLKINPENFETKQMVNRLQGAQ